MQKSIWLAPLALLAMAFALAGCGGGGETWTGIEGYVTEGRGDNARAGVTVELHAIVEQAGTYLPTGSLGSPQATAATDAAGHYRFEGLAAGTYLVRVPAGGDLPAACYQHLVIGGDGDRLRADLVVRPPFPAGEAAGMPLIDSIVNITDPVSPMLLQSGASLSGTARLRLTVQPATGLPVKQIMVKIGHKSTGPDFVFDDGSATVEFDLDTTALGNGNTFLHATVYDLNDNAASVQIPFTVNNGVSGVKPAAPTIVRVEAWTFAEPYGFKSPRRSLNLPPVRIKLGDKAVYLPNASALVAGSRAITGPGCALVHIQIKPAGDATSYRIYRKTGEKGTYALIGERMNDPRWYEKAYYITGPLDGTPFDALWFDDLDPALAVNQDYYYKIAAVNAAGETDSGHQFRVRILPKFTATLDSPDNNLTGVAGGSTPLFSWSIEGGMNDIAYTAFIIYVLNKDDEPLPGEEDKVPFSWLRVVYGQTSLAYMDVIDANDSQYDENLVIPRPLVPGAIYEWDLAIASSGAMYQGMNFGESYASFSSYPRVDFGSTNGAFFFTTAPLEEES
ncbi:MAG: hypothetical protein ACM3X6_14255 [Patescibacteria group bacterium]